MAKTWNFDRIIDRRGTCCFKYDLPMVGERIPLWVADMDFATPDFILDALKARLEHPVLGYSIPPEDYYKTISSWVKELHGWEVPADDIRFIPGIVRGIGMVLGCFFHEPVKVIIQPPVYHPFRILPQKNGCEVVYNPLVPIEENGELKGYRMNLEQLESLIDDRTKVLILSNPQNPAGICWDPDELRALADICSRRGVLVISDEIHAEMAHRGFKHYPFASVSQAAADCSITFMSPSKTFNIAGVVSSYTIVRNPELREKFFNYLEANEFDAPNIFSSVVTMAAYKQGAEWRAQMLEYVEGNIDFTQEWFKANLPAIKPLKPQASFLVWLDCRGLGLDQAGLLDLFENRAGLFLNDGSIFGPGGEGDGFMRLNVGCPRSVLQTAFGRLKEAIGA